MDQPPPSGETDSTPVTSTPVTSGGARARLVRELNQRRRDVGLSHRQLAERTGYSRQHVAQAESGKIIPSRPLVCALDRVLNAEGALIALREQAKNEQREVRRHASQTAQSITGRITEPECSIPQTPVGADPTVSLGDTAWTSRDATPHDADDVYLGDMGPATERPGPQRRGVPALADPYAVRTATLRWLINPPRPAGGRTVAGRRVGAGDVRRVRAVRQHLKGLDDAHGGGTAYPMAVSYLRTEVEPLLDGSYGETTGQMLMEIAAELVLDVGWMAYDEGTDQRLARGYMLHALRLAHAAHNRMLGGRILCALSHQALHLGEVSLAVDLVRAARTGIAGRAPAKARAMLAAMEACVHAANNNAAQCAASLSQAEKALSDADTDEENLEWLDFDEGGLWGHAARAYRDLAAFGSGINKTDKARVAQRYAVQSVALCRPAHSRTRAQRNAILAGTHLQLGEADQAAAVGARILADAWSVQSAHVYADIAALVADIDTVGEPVEEFVTQARELLSTTR